MKIMALVPCLMLPNNRDINKKSIKENMGYGFDEFVIYDQCFDEDDFIEGCTYIGHAKERMGWVLPRNELLKYFYNSDFDYAWWIDANSTISGPTQNDLVTVIENVKNGNLSKCDAIFATLGLWVSQDRIEYKSRDDFEETVHAIPIRSDKSYNWMHGLVMKNYKKYYNNEYYIDERCDTRKGTADDVYFSRLLRRQVSCYVTPTVVINKPSSKMSCTWANEKGTYDYPPTLYDVVDSYIQEHLSTYNEVPKRIIEDITLKRVDYKKDCIKPYVPRGKKAKIEETETTHKTVELF